MGWTGYTRCDGDPDYAPHCGCECSACCDARKDQNQQIRDAIDRAADYCIILGKPELAAMILDVSDSVRDDDHPPHAYIRTARTRLGRMRRV